MRMARLISGSGILALIIPVALCGQELVPAPPPPVYPNYEVETRTKEPELLQRVERQKEQYNLPKKLEQHQMRLAVETALRNDGAVPANNIDVKVAGNVVELSGEVANMMIRSRAERLAENVRGVQRVDNKMVISQVEMTGEEMKQFLQDTLQSDPATQRYDLDVSVAGDTAIVSGQVNSWSEKNLASEVLMSAPGIQQIDNRIEVAVLAERPDADVMRDVLNNIRNAQLLQPRDLRVDVEEGNVRISGIVRSVSSKERLEELAQVPGVQSVNSDNVLVEWWSVPEETASAEVSTVNDDSVRDAVLYRLAQNARVSPFNIEVNVENGTAYLTGTVNNLASRMAATEVARATTGVYRVRNMLDVRPGQIFDNETLVEYLRERFRRDFFLGNDSINVSATRGIVTLAGSVDSRFERIHAEELASRIAGVVQVRNNLDVASPAEAREDWEMRQDVLNALEWNPLIQAKRVNVHVDRGTVILSGWVDQWHQRALAEDVAYKTGAPYVYNRIRVPNSPTENRRSEEVALPVDYD